MTIGHYAPQLWANGGIASYVRRLGRAQTEAGHAVLYLSADAAAGEAPDRHHRVRDDADLFGQARRYGLDVLHLHKPVRTLPADRVPTLRTMHGHQGSCPSATRYLARQRRPCDRAYGLVGCALGHLADRCGSRHPQRMLAALAGVPHERSLAAEIHTVTVSQFLKDQMVRAGCAEAHLHALLSPAPEAPPYRRPPRHGIPHVAFLGRLVPQKGIDWLLRALALRGAPAHLDVAGEGPQRAELEALAAELGLADRVTFHGWLGPEDARRLIQASRAVVVPSVWHEPAGLVTLEAGACGRAVVAGRVGGIPEYVDENAALLVAPHDVADLADALATVIEDPALAERLGRAGRDRVRAQFALGRFVDDLDALYHLAIRDRLDASPPTAAPASRRRSAGPALVP